MNSNYDDIVTGSIVTPRSTAGTIIIRRHARLSFLHHTYERHNDDSAAHFAVKKLSIESQQATAP